MTNIIKPLNTPAPVNARFFAHPMPNAEKSKAEGRMILEDVEVCEISFPGNKHTIGVFPAHDIAETADRDNGYMIVKENITYAMKYNDEYMAFKRGGGTLSVGTPIDMAPFLTQSRKMELKAIKVFTIEALAALDSSALKMVGQGGRDLKNQAIAFLEDSKNAADTVKMNKAIAARDAEIAELKSQMQELLGKTKPDKQEQSKQSIAGAFETFENIDLLNWIADSNPDHGFDDTTTREELLLAAEEILAREGKKKNKAA